MTSPADPARRRVLRPTGPAVRLQPAGKAAPRNGLQRKSLISGSTLEFSSYMRTVGSSRTSAADRARDPFTHHPWVFAAAVTLAIVASQAPPKIMVETDELADEFRRKATLRGRAYTRRHGAARRFVLRHLSKSPAKRLYLRGLEEDLDHPLSTTLLKPNPYLSGDQLFLLTNLWLSVVGEHFWVLTDENGRPIGPNEMPANIWPLGPGMFTPLFSDGTMGDLVGWRFSPPNYMKLRLKGTQVDLGLHQVVQFKLPDPANPIRGMSRLGAGLLGIEADLSARDHTRALTANGCDPGGILSVDTGFESEEARSEFLLAFEQRHRGAFNARRTALLEGGQKYTPIAFTPQEMQFSDLHVWYRDEVLALLGVPKSSLGITEYVNYATQLGQDSNFWHQTIIPQLKGIETTINGSLLFEEPDSIGFAFDLSQVEALRIAVIEKTKAALQLCGTELHMPPRAAFELMDIDAPDYPADDTSLVPAGLTSAEAAAEMAAVAPFDPSMEAPSVAEKLPLGEPNAADGLNEPSQTAPATNGQSVPANDQEMARHRLTRAKAKVSANFLRFLDALEVPGRAAFRKWVNEEELEHRRAFEKWVSSSKALLVRAPAKLIDPTAVLPDVRQVGKRLRKHASPVLVRTIDKTWKFTLDETGAMPAIDMDDASVMDLLELRLSRLSDTRPRALRKNLTRTLSKAIAEGETIQEMRDRIAAVFKVTRSEGNALTWARTEIGGFVNGVRHEMFVAQGFTKHLWTTATDEGVREDHVTFGKQPAREIGFDYLSLVGGGGRLRYPGDVEAPASQVANCRCAMVVTE